VDRRTRAIFLLGGCLLILAAAAVYVVGVVGGSAGTLRASGVIVRVESEGIDRVRSFDLRTPDGAIVSFAIGVLENATSFPPSHLAEHQATAQPVIVTYRVEGGDNVAVRLEDAP
jgi:hypothetical protein